MRMPRPIEVLENDRNLLCVAVCLPSKIDASQFSGPEQCFAGAPCISVLNEIERRIFDANSIDADASIEVLENDRNLQCVAGRLREEIDASRFPGTEPLASISLIHPTARAHSRGDFATRITTSSLSFFLHIFLFTFFFLSLSLPLVFLPFPPP